MVLLVFTARLQQPRGWRFWRRRVAEVFAWIPTRSCEEAEARARSDLGRRGYTIDAVHVRRDLGDARATVRDPSARRNAWLAERFGEPVYRFQAPSSLWAPEASEAPAVRTRLLDDPAVRIDPGRVPEGLRPLLPLATTWAILDDRERERFIASVAPAERSALAAAVLPHLPEIEAFSRRHAGATPVPDEVLALDLLAEAADEAADEAASERALSSAG